MKRKALLRQDVESSNIASIGYDEDEQILEVEFNSGGVYQYLNVPKDVYDDFYNADSKGHFLHVSVKPDFEYRRVSNSIININKMADKDTDSQIEMGIKVEMEHIDTLKKVIEDVKADKLLPLEEYTKLIVEDHLKELPDYYTRLKEMENKKESNEPFENLVMRDKNMWGIEGDSTNSNISYLYSERNDLLADLTSSKYYLQSIQEDNDLEAISSTNKHIEDIKYKLEKIEDQIALLKYQKEEKIEKEEAISWDEIVQKSKDWFGNPSPEIRTDDIPSNINDNIVNNKDK